MTMAKAALETVLRRDRIVVAAALAGVAALAWGYVLWPGADMNMGGMDMTGFRMIPAGLGIIAPANAPWRTIEFAFVFAIWAVMMVGMMAPSAAPMILMYARVGRQAAAEGTPFAATGWFAGGYFLAWIGFSLVATVAQCALLDVEWRGPVTRSEGRLPYAMPTPLLFLMRHGGFHRDAFGCLLLGAAPRGLLRRLLLDADGTFVRGRRYERALDRAPRVAHSFGEAFSIRALDRTCCGRCFSRCRSGQDRS